MFNAFLRFVKVVISFQCNGCIAFDTPPPVSTTYEWLLRLWWSADNAHQLTFCNHQTLCVENLCIKNTYLLDIISDDHIQCLEPRGKYILIKFKLFEMSHYINPNYILIFATIFLYFPNI